MAAAANVRPSGVVLDIRGHTLPQFQTSPLAVFPQLLTTLTDAVAAWKGFGQPTPLTVTVPSFFDTGLYQYQVGATQQSFMRWVRTKAFAKLNTRTMGSAGVHVQRLHPPAHPPLFVRSFVRSVVRSFVRSFAMHRLRRRRRRTRATAW